MKLPFVVNISGGSGSGKTTIVRMIKEKCTAKNIFIFSQDHYYRDQSHLPSEERETTNYDHPDAFDHDRLCSDLRNLSQGKNIYQPTYDFASHTRTSHMQEVSPPDIILVDGIFSLHFPELLQLSHLKLYVEVSDDIRFIRRLRRDIMERGRSMESVINQYLTTVRPMHSQFVEPTKRHADFVVLWESRNMDTVDRIVGMIS